SSAGIAPNLHTASASATSDSPAPCTYSHTTTFSAIRAIVKYGVSSVGFSSRSGNIRLHGGVRARILCAREECQRSSLPARQVDRSVALPVWPKTPQLPGMRVAPAGLASGTAAPAPLFGGSRRRRNGRPAAGPFREE